MDSVRYYTTTGQVFDYLVDFHRKTGECISFPEALEQMRQRGMLSPSPIPLPPFHSPVDLNAFWAHIRALPITATAILPQSRTFRDRPEIEEHNIFPPGKDVFCFLNMPYMAEYLHSHGFFELTYVLSGSCTFLFEGESAALSAGDICIVSPSSRHSLPLEPGCLALSIVVRKSTFDSLFGNLLSQQDLLGLFFRTSLYEARRANYILLKTGNNQSVYASAQQLVYESNLEDNYSNSCSASLLNLFLAQSLRASSAAVTLHHFEGFRERDLDFSLILQYVQQNYRTVTLTSLSRTFHFSETYLSKLIRKNLNQTFTQVLRTLKMRHALDYLLNTSMKVSEIASAVGYDSVDHFSRTFRSVYGMPPQEYKKRHQPSRS